MTDHHLRLAEEPRDRLSFPRARTSRCKDVELTKTEVDILRETAKRLRWIGATVTADVMQGIVKRWEVQ